MSDEDAEKALAETEARVVKLIVDLRHQNKLLRLSLVEETQARLRVEEALAAESLKRVAAEQAYTQLFAQLTEAD